MFYVRKHIWSEKKLDIIDWGPFKTKDEAREYIFKVSKTEKNTNYSIYEREDNGY